jgi:hypothetical protein
MKIFLSALENGNYEKIIELDMLYNLMSFYYIKGKFDLACKIRDKSQLIMIDSGAHSFQKGVKVDWDKYTDQYATFITKFDKPNVVGYFEMDVDNVIGYDAVLELRKKLEKVSNKIIPVWHRNRGIDDYKKMCQDYSGRVIAITGFKNEDIKDDQYLMFLKYAKRFDCKVHCLGMTRKKILDKVPFDYTDSSAWRQNGIYGRINGKKIDREFNKNNYGEVFLASYLEGMKMQKEYERKWKLYE